MIELSNPLIAYIAVFFAGLVASASPCVLVIIPLVIGFVGGYSEGDIKKSALYALLFSLGLSITFTLLGALAAVTGTLMGNMSGAWKYLLAAVLLIMGLQMTELTRFNLPSFNLPRIKQRGLAGALILGLLFGVMSSPCATPVLAVILTFVASRQNVLYGVSLLFVYALAHTFLIFIVGMSTAAAEAVLKSQKVQNISRISHKLSGIVFILMAVFMLLYYR